jgi:hypothetical protein
VNLQNDLNILLSFIYINEDKQFILYHFLIILINNVNKNSIQSIINTFNVTSSFVNSVIIKNVLNKSHFK